MLSPNNFLRKTQAVSPQKLALESPSDSEMGHQTVDVAMNGKAAEMFTQQGKERSASSHRSSNWSQNNFMLSD